MDDVNSWPGVLPNQCAFGINSSDDTESHPQRHTLTATLGPGREVIPQTPEQPVPLEEGNVLVLCPDGLWSVVGEAELGRLALQQSPAEACVKLVQAALKLGGPDNVTVVVLRLSGV